MRTLTSDWGEPKGEGSIEREEGGEVPVGF